MDTYISHKSPTRLEGIRVLETDPKMRGIINSVGEISLEPHGISMFEALVNSIISQQISKSSASTIKNRFVEFYPTKRFPTPLDVLSTSPQDLRNIGLSNAKTIYVQGLAQSDISGFVPTLESCALLDDSQIIDLLTQLKGIGLWSVQMILIFNLARPDIFPASDRGILRAFGLIYLDGAMPTTGEALDYSIHWQPYRSLASRYLWQSLNSGIV
jgi:DNA-3-methyladenine glycosylase II